MGTHGDLLQVTVSCCNHLKDTEWISRQDPYVCVEYGGNRSRTRTCTDGGKNPTFRDKFVYAVIEGLKELNVNVWNSNLVNHDAFIGSGKVHLAKALSHGFDDSTWPLQSKTGRHAGEIRLIIEYTSYANKPPPPANNHPQPNAPPQPSPYYAPMPSPYQPPPPSAAQYVPPVGYHPASSPYPSYQPNFGANPPSAYPPHDVHYAQPYPPNPVYSHQPFGFVYHPPQPYGFQYPPQQHGFQYPHGPSYP